MLKNNRKGFTLIELLATIAVLSIIITIVIYFAMNIINNAKDKSYKVTINTIEKITVNYINENFSNLKWLPIDDDNEYQCIKVNNLIEKGYFDNDILDSHVTKDLKVNPENYIYLERNLKTKTINKEIFLHDGISNDLSGLCLDYKRNGNINFYVNSIGEEFNGYVRKKDITIKYKLFNIVDNISNYGYYYEYSNDENIKENESFENLSIEKKITVDKNGSLYAEIIENNNKMPVVNKTILIDKIDNISPNINYKYTGNNPVKDNVEIKLIITDNESGVNVDSFDINDLSVTIGDDKAEKIKLEKVSVSSDKKEAIYNLIIYDSSHRGNVNIEILSEAIEDNLENKNKSKKLTTNIEFIKDYNVIYYLGNGTSTEKSTKIGETTCVYGEDCNLQKFNELGQEFPVSSGNSPDNHWNFYGWITENLNASQKDYSNPDYTNGEKINISYDLEDNTITLYAIGKKQFRFYTGKNPSSSEYTEVFQYWNPYSIDESYLTSIKIPQYENIEGWTFIGYKGGSTDTSLSIDFESSKIGDELKPAYDQARWIRSKYSRTLTIKFNANGGKGTMNPLLGTQIYNSGYNNNSKISSVTFDLPVLGFTYDGRTFNGWKSDFNNEMYNDKEIGIEHNPSVESSSVIIFSAQWIEFVSGNVIIKYNTNGGDIISSGFTANDDGVISHNGSDLINLIPYGGSLTTDGLNNYNNTSYLNIDYNTRVAVSGSEWKCLSGCSTSNKTFNQSTIYSDYDFCDASKGDCTVVIGVNWSDSINSTRFSCEANDSMAKYNFTTCNGDICSFDSKNRLSSSFGSWTSSSKGDIKGTPTWSKDLTQVTLYKNLSDLSNIASEGYVCNRYSLYVNATNGLHCRSSPTTNSNIVETFVNNTKMLMWPSTMKYNTSYKWYYSSEYDCYLAGQYISTTKDTSSGSSTGGSSSTTISGECRCKYVSNTCKSDNCTVAMKCSAHNLKNYSSCSSYCSRHYAGISSSTCKTTR